MEDDIRQDINAVVSTSPAARKQQAQNFVNQTPPAPQEMTPAPTSSPAGVGMTTRATTPSGEVLPTTTTQETTTLSRGVKFTDNPEEATDVYTGGGALPGETYYTRYRDTDGSEGDPFYFVPNFQPVVPYVVSTPNGEFETNTINPHKIAWQIEQGLDGYPDVDYAGYYRVPDIGNESWWSQFSRAMVGGVTKLPIQLGQGAFNLGGTPVSGAARAIAEATKGSVVGDTMGAISDGFENFSAVMNSGANSMLGGLDSYFVGDPTDQSMSANIARGIGGAIPALGAALLTGRPDLVFIPLAFSGAENMRQEALNAGLSPMASYAAAMGASTAIGALDTVSYGIGLAGTSALAARGATDVLKDLNRSGLYRFGKRTARELAGGSVEAGTEMIQTAIENSFNADFWEDPTDELAVAGIAGFAMKAMMLPESVRHARAEERELLAQQLGVAAELQAVRQEGIKLVDSWVEAGKLPTSMRDEVLDLLIRESPDVVVRTIQEGIAGQLDKVPAKTRQSFARQLSQIDPAAVSAKEYATLDAKVLESIRSSNVPFTEAEANTIRGIMRGLANIKLLEDGTLPSQIKVPKFIETTMRGVGGYYNPATNQIGISRFVSRDTPANITDGRPYNRLVREGFQISDGLSERTEVIVHEMSHYVDRQVGEGFGAFLREYYSAIKKVFGPERAAQVRANIEQTGTRRGRSRDYESPTYSTENFAQAAGRLGREAGRALGLNNSRAQQFASYANIILNQLNKVSKGMGVVKTRTAIDNFQDALNAVISRNNKALDDLIQVYGSERLQAAARDFMEQREFGFGDFLAQRDLLQDLYDVADAFYDAAGLEKLNTAFGGVAPADFVEQGQILFDSGFNRAFAPVVEKSKQEMTGPTPEPIEAKEATADSWAKTSVTPKESEETDALIINETAQQNITESLAKGQEVINPFDVKVHGRTIKDDIAALTEGVAGRERMVDSPDNAYAARKAKFINWCLGRNWLWGVDSIVQNLFGKSVGDFYDLQGRYAEKQATREAYINQFYAKVAPILGDKNTAYQFDVFNNQMAMVRARNVSIRNPLTGSVSTRDLTGWEVAYIYLTARQGQQYANRIQMTTDSDLQTLIDTLSDKEKQMLDAMSEFLQDVRKDYLTRKYFNGIEPTDDAGRQFMEKQTVPNYFPLQSAAHEFYNETGIDTFKNRTDTSDPIAIVDAGKVFSRALNRYASARSDFFITVKRLKAALQFRGPEQLTSATKLEYNEAEEAETIQQSARLAERVMGVLGVDGYRNLIRNLDYFLSSDANEPIQNTKMNQIANNMYKYYLGFKPISFVKNLANITGFWGAASNQSVYWSNFAQGIGNATETWKWMMDAVPLLKSRLGGSGIEEHLGLSAAGGDAAALFSRLKTMKFSKDSTGNLAKITAVLQSLNELGLKSFMKTGDAVANVFGGYALMQDYMAQGMTKEQAGRKLTRFIEEHQSSSNLTMKPLLQLEANKSIAGYLFTFMSEPVAKFSSMIRGFDSAARGDTTKKEAAMNTVATATSMLAYSLIAAGVAGLFSDDEEAQEATQEALLREMLSTVGGTTIFGNIVTPLLSNLLGVSTQGGVNVPVVDFFSDIATDVRKGEVEQVILKSLVASGLFLGAPTVANEIQGAMLLGSDDPDVREAGFMMLTGRTPNYAMTRTGTEDVLNPKENVESEEEE